MPRPFDMHLSPPREGTIARRIWTAMRAIDMESPNDLAKVINVPRGTVHRWFKESSNAITPQLLYAVSDALSCNPRWLCSGKGSMAPVKELTPDELSVIQLWESLPQAAREEWVKQGVGLQRLTAGTSAANPFPRAAVK